MAISSEDAIFMPTIPGEDSGKTQQDRCLEDIADNNPVSDHITEFKVPVQRISAERVLEPRGRKIVKPQKDWVDCSTNICASAHP
jgi:hypothetical protein